MEQNINHIEQQRLALQAEIDGQKTQLERNRLGQFSTPTNLAQEILRHTASLFSPGEKLRFLDPAIGTGAFYAALRKEFREKRITEALGFEIDPLFCEAASRLWKELGLTITLSDFTHVEPSPRFNLIICNPPYVRHHHLHNGDKNRLKLRTLQASGMKISGLAGLYCHFLGLSHAWMADGGVAGWLIPSEFMDVNYGREVKRYLLEKVMLLRIHRFDPNEVQFGDALVSSAVVWFRKSPSPKDHAVTFTFGGSILAPRLSRLVPVHELAREPKWTRFPTSRIRNHSGVPTLSEFFQIKRGLATGDNSFFILPEEEIRTHGLPNEVFDPIFPSPRYLTDDEVSPRNDGTPDIARRLFLLNTRLGEDEIRERFPSLHTYLKEGRERGIHERYLCVHRSPWYAQENRPPAPIVCTYIGRGDTKRRTPFRFILNRSRATVANVYLAMYPTPLLNSALESDPGLIRQIWKVLNEIPPSHLIDEGRVYGGGLHKLEPKELGNVNAEVVFELLKPSKGRQLKMFSKSGS